jgi:hypothetical protein
MDIPPKKLFQAHLSYKSDRHGICKKKMDLPGQNLPEKARLKKQNKKKLCLQGTR